MANVVSFEEFESESQIGAHQAGLPRIILEGRDDVRLFTDWFRYLLDRLQFVEAGAVVRGGGCTSVAAAVEKSRRTDGVPAVGVLDRDCLFRGRDWLLLFTRDEGAFQARQTADVIVATLWEVEAYLLRPDLLADWIRARRDQLPAPPEECAGALTAALEECEALLSAAPVFAAAHAAGQVCAHGHGLHLDHALFPGECERLLSGAMATHPSVVDEVRGLVADVRAHAPAAEPERLVYYLRYVDTKRLLGRLVRRFKLRGSDSHWALSMLMTREAYSPPELKRIVDEQAERWAA